MKVFNIGEASKFLKIPFYTLQYAERVGKIPKARRSSSGHRIYTEQDLTELKDILNCKKELVEAN